MAKRIRVTVDDVVAEAQLYEDLAPNTIAAFWEALPIQDRTIQARWSGNAWRTGENYYLLPEGTPVENVRGPLSAGDVIYYPGYRKGLVKIAIAYGDAQWLGPFMSPNEVALIGKIDTNLDAFVKRCQQIIFEGPMDVTIERID